MKIIAVAGFALTAVLGASSAAVARADDGVSDVRITPGVLVIQGGGDPVPFTVTAKLPADPNGLAPRFYSWELEGNEVMLDCENPAAGTWLCMMPSTVSTGKWIVAVSDGTNDADNATPFYVKHATKITRFDAGPEPVRKGKMVTVKGRLWKARRAQAVFDPYVRKTVGIYFRAIGAADFVYVTSTKTDRAGRFSKKVKAKKTGTWRVVFAGTDDHAPSRSAGDKVKVR